MAETKPSMGLGLPSSYPPVAMLPTQVGPSGVRYDFNTGCRVTLPIRESGVWRVVMRDLDTNNILFDHETQGAEVNSTKRWFVRFALDVWEIDGATKSLVLSHQFDPTGHVLLVMFPIGTLGDTIAWFSYVARFARKHAGAKVICALADRMIPLLAANYPELELVTHDDIATRSLAETAYATYYLGLFFDDAALNWQPTDFRFVGLHRTAGYILGVDPTEEAPRLVPSEATRPIAEPYVVIAVQSSSGAKYWNNPDGWRAVIALLRTHGYRVVCIDQKPVHGTGMMWTHIPHGCEDETGDRPLAERARWLQHADFFIGLSSGLAWLAWAAGCPVVLISGFTHPSNEFDTPHRVINWHTCNSCWNDPTERFDHHDFFWCPRHANTPRQFECTRLITAEQVCAAIAAVPGFRTLVEGQDAGEVAAA